MAASEVPNEAASPQAATRAGWSAEVLQLTTLLMLSNRESVRQRVTDLFRAQTRPIFTDLLSELRPMADEMIREVSEAMATALGTDADAVVRYALPRSRATELAGRHSIERRLDRVWGGHSMASLEAMTELRLIWPGPCTGHVLLLHGRGEVNAGGWNPHQTLSLSTGDTVQVEAGGVILLQTEPVALVVEAAMAAGLKPPQLQATPAVMARRGIPTPLGRVALENQVLHLNQRQIVLTAQEARTMHSFMKTPGQVVEREELARLLGVRPRGVDRVVVSLRNKLGDGLITTIYGSGYILEICAGAE